MAAAPQESVVRKPAVLLPAAGIFIVFLVLYAATAQRGVSWQDSGEFQWRILTGDYHWFSGLARAHPLYILLARGFTACFPADLFFAAANLFSGVGLALANSLLFLLATRLSGRRTAGVAAAALFGLAHMPWWMATIAEVYSWSAACFALELLLLARTLEQPTPARWAGVGLANGLGLAYHNFALLTLPVLGIALLRSLPSTTRRRGLTAAAAGFLLGALPLLALAPGEWTGQGGLGTLRSLLFGYDYAGQVLGTDGFRRSLVFANLALFGVSLLNPGWRFAFRGLRDNLRNNPENHPFLRWVRWILAIHALFFLRYFVPDQATFSLPLLLLLALFAGLGLVAKEPDPLRAARIIAIGAACAVLAPQAVLRVVKARDLLPPRARTLPYRDEAAYWLLPWKQHEQSARLFVQGTDAAMPPDGTLIADTTTAGPLMAWQAAQSAARQTSWHLVTPWDETRGEPPFFVVSPVAGYAPAWLLDGGWRFEPQGVVWRATRPEADTP